MNKAQHVGNTCSLLQPQGVHPRTYLHATDHDNDDKKLQSE